MFFVLVKSRVKDLMHSIDTEVSSFGNHGHFLDALPWVEPQNSIESLKCVLVI